MTREQLMNECCDMLQSNINKMRATDSLRELNSMYDLARQSIVTIYHENFMRLKETIGDKKWK